MEIINEDYICPECGTEMNESDSGSYKHIEWFAYTCPSCGYTYTEEPDWDSMPGGHDDY